ncbi:hypothetical protein [Halovivax cerinus]|uniref:CARDB domain-containing protein n=1 Tax=Halovivax cerinus TaxID=1487865 RepID=A0ABD5NKZ3_9EURY|nr:hypothetical protein [Halovivax cerinus]
MTGRTLRTLGLVLVVAGAVLVTGPAFGFSTLSADRGVSVGTAPIDSALLAIEPTGETPSNQNDAVVIEITNNGNEQFDPLSAQAVIVDDTKGALAISSSFDSVLDPGATTGLELTCSGGGDGTATVAVTADAAASSFSIGNVSYTYTFSYSCTGGGGGGTGPAQFEASDVSAAEQRQTFTLDGTALKNKDQFTIDLTDPQESGQVDYSGLTDADVTVVQGSARSVGYDAATNAITYEAQGNQQGPIEIEISNIDVLGMGGGTITYEDTTGRTDSDDFDSTP